MIDNSKPLLDEPSETYKANQQKMLERLQKRHHQRELLLNEAKKSAPNVTKLGGASIIEKFDKQFYPNGEALRALFQAEEYDPKIEESVNGGISGLKTLLSEHASALASFQVEKAQSFIDVLSQQLQAWAKCSGQKTTPSGFGFVKKPSDVKIKVAESSCEAVSGDVSVTNYKHNGFKYDGLVVSDKSKEIIVVDKDCSTDVLLLNLYDCQVSIRTVLPSIRVRNLQNCKVTAFPVSTAVLLEDCADCTFVVACQQLRVHNTKNTKFFLHTTSQPIIEGSSGLIFAPYNIDEDISEAWQKSGLSPKVNLWNEVQDFDWLVPAVPSPNWKLLG